MILREKMKQGPVFGIACFTRVTYVTENVAVSDLDFVYLDLEYTDRMLNGGFEKQTMAVKFHDISVLMRMADDDEVAIRKMPKWETDGVVIPHCKTTAMTKRCVEAVKFSPPGRGGGESNVGVTGFDFHDFDWSTCMKQQNRDTLVIPVDEDYEFTGNIDEVLSVPDVNAVNFGLIDYAVSKGLKVGYTMGEEVEGAYRILVEKCRGKGIGVLGSAVLPTKENLKQAVRDGYTMVILGNDMWHFQRSLGELMSGTVKPVRSEK